MTEMGVLEGYLRYGIREENRLVAVKSALLDVVAPFNPGTVTLTIEESLFSTRNLRVHFGNWPSLGFVVDISDYEFESFPIRIAEGFTQNTPYVEADPSFGLGEN